MSDQHVGQHGCRWCRQVRRLIPVSPAPGAWSVAYCATCDGPAWRYAVAALRAREQ